MNVDFPRGTTVAEAKEEQELLRQTGNKFATKFKYSKNLQQFYIGEFELRLDEADLSYLKNDVEDRMLIRKEPETAKQFYDTTRLLNKHNVAFAHLMDTTGDSYLAAIYLMKIRVAGDQENTAFIPKKAKKQGHRKTCCLLPIHHHTAGPRSEHLQRGN